MRWLRTIRRDEKNGGNSELRQPFHVLLPCPMTLVRLPTIFEEKKKRSKREKKGSEKRTIDGINVHDINEHREYINRARSDERMSAICTILQGIQEGNEGEREILKAEVAREIGVFSNKFTKSGRNDGLGNNTYIRTQILYVYRYIIVIAR